jgi:Domain of unknown function (DUF4160)
VRYDDLVGRVASLTLAGLDLWFNSDDHLPPHFHAEKPGEWEVRVYFLRDASSMFEAKWSKSDGRPSKGDLRMLAKAVVGSRAELLGEWHEKVNVKVPGADR